MRYYNEDIWRVHCHLVERYRELLPECRERELCKLFIDEGRGMPADKQGRWVGYIQAKVISLGLSTVEDERKISRPLFHEVYERYSLSTKTVGI